MTEEGQHESPDSSKAGLIRSMQQTPLRLSGLGPRLRFRVEAISIKSGALFLHQHWCCAVYCLLGCRCLSWRLGGLVWVYMFKQSLVPLVKAKSGVSEGR